MDCDVLVIGGGVTGVAAAVASARTQAKTVLLEARPFVGGNADTGLCLHNFITKSDRQVVYGIAQEIVDRLTEMGGAVGHVPFSGFVRAVTPVDGEMFKVLSTKMLAESGVRVLYGLTAMGAKIDNGYVKSVEAAGKGGLYSFRAKVYIDASGDADLAIKAGAGYRQGEENTGRMQPVSMLLHAYGTDNEKIVTNISEVEPARATRTDYPVDIPVYFNGTFTQWNDLVMKEKIFPNENHKVFFNTVWPNQINVNTSAVTGVDGTDPLALSEATVHLTIQLEKISCFLKKHVPGFENAYFTQASFAGVRETRNIEGLYEIDDEDVKTGRKFADTIGQVCFPVDIHDPLTGQAHFAEIGGDGAFDIPLRALIPKNLANVLVAGRCISASSYANGSTRNNVPCLVMGEGAGVAAGLAALENMYVPELDISKLQGALQNRGVFLG